MASAPSDNADLVCLGPTKRGRPSGYSDELAAAICERIANGETLTAICNDEDMPHRITVTRWLMKGEGDFPQRYARAREQQADYEAEEIRDISDNMGILPEHKRIMVDTRKWRAERLNRRVYGNSVKHEHELSAPEPLKPGGLPASLGFLAIGGGDSES